MKKNCNKFCDFSMIALCFIILMLITKLFDFLDMESFLKAVIHSLATSSFIILAVFVVYYLISILSKKFADCFMSILLGIMIASEIGLTIYSHESGQLMGAELFLRPMSEIIQTVRSSMSLFWVVVAVIAVIVCFSLLTYFARKKIKSSSVSIVVFSLMLLSIPAAFFVDDIMDGSDNIQKRNRETSKLWYLLLSSMNSHDIDDGSEVVYDEKLIDEFLSENPEYIVPDKHYPLERIDRTPDVLGRYFKESDVKPDVVIILVESLGVEMMGSDGFSPFIDSLAQNSLYWKNCLSTTIRSYGAVPAITSSTVGPKGFQFGVMPEHNSLFSIMQSNGYNTNVFYGGDFTFDCISEYLVAQNVDYMSDFYAEYSKNFDMNLGNWWGYYDHIMFDKSIDKIKGMDSPMFNLLITITNHESLNINDEIRHKEYSDRADRIIYRMSPDKASLYKKNKMRFCSMLYTDDCVRDFINAYKELPNYDNTIFIITGDHSSGLILKNKLSYHTVPLIIWSPMLEEPSTFNSIVTHNDIAPSINALLRNKFNLRTPNMVHWAGDGLDTSEQMNFKKKMIHVNYNREMRELVYDDYVYWTKNQWEAEQVNKLDSNIDMKIVYDDSLLSLMNKKLELYKYIYRYTYFNNKLTQIPINEGKDYEVFKSLSENRKVKCQTPKKKPSEIGSKRFDIFDEIVVNENVDKIKVTIDAEVFVNDSLWQDEYMDLVVECKEIDSDKKTVYIDKFSKFINADIIRDDSWYDMSVSKEFMVSRDKRHAISIYISSSRYDDQWVAGSTVTIGERDAVIMVTKSEP